MILISAGHHPYRKGATYGDFNEHDEACIWVSLLCNMLGSDALSVPAGILKNKIEFINRQKDLDFAVEIHFNSALNADGKHVGIGSETLYYPGSEAGLALATIIQERLSRVFSPNRGAKEGYYQMNKSKGPDYFLAKTRCPAVIIEPEFIHLKDYIKEHREAGCKELAQSLETCLTLLEENKNAI